MIVLVRPNGGCKPEGAVISTRERIVDAASVLFMQRGYAGSGLKQIATESEAPIGSLYHFFPGGKRELATETLRRSGRAYQELVEAVLDGAPDIASGVRACFDGAATTLRATHFADACPIATVALEVASTDEPLREVTAEIFGAWLHAAENRFVAAGIDEHRARELAQVLVASLEGGFLLCRAAKDTAAMQSIGDAMVRLVEEALVT
jgi:AcrR family transcriptional regulator